MNKISKKIVALVTMAAFVLTLVPAAAFAAYGSTVSVNKDYDQVTLANVTTGADIKIDLSLVAEDVEKADDTTDGVYVWLTKDGIPYTSYVTYDGAEKVTGKSGNLNGAGKVSVTGSVAVDKSVTITVKNTGVYTVHAGLANTGDYTKVNSLSDLTEIAAGSLSTSEVVAADVEVNSIQVTAPSPEADPAQTAESGTIKYLNEATPNSIDAQTVTAAVTGVLAEDGATSADVSGQTVAIENGNTAKGVYVFEKGTENEISEVTVNDDGNIEFDIKAMSGTKAGTYHIYLVAGSVEYDLSVLVGESTVDSIEVVDTDNNVVATKNFDFAGVVEFAFKDAAGNNVAAPTLKYQVVSAPDNHGIDASADLSVEKIDDKDTYKLKISNVTTLKAGDYTIRVAIPNGKSVEVSFTAAKAGDPVDLSIEMASGVDTIVAGETATGTVYEIDANGIKTKAGSNVTLGYTGAAVDTTQAATLSDGGFTVKAKDREALLGSKITVTALDSDAGILVTKDLTVVDGLSNYTLEFDSTNGEAGKDNTVNVSVVDENGNVKNVSGKAYAYVESTTDENAKVTVSDEVNVTNGKAKLTLFSNIETGANIVVAVKDDQAIYANTLSYTFGEEDVNADTIVAMTIGSTDMIVNNELVNGDAAPYVADGRTMVPIRALTETFGAKVDYDNDAQTVTIVDGDTTVVMTIGETTYTVNGEEKTMDVAPVIGSGDRTYVPVRFVAEALGYKVTPLYAADNTTASVVFQK